MGNAITVPVSQLQDPVILPASPQAAATASAPGKAITVPVSQLSEPAQPETQTGATSQPQSTGSSIWSGVKQGASDVWNQVKQTAAAIEPPALRGDFSQGSASILPPAYVNLVGSTEQGVKELPLEFHAYEKARQQGASPVQAAAQASGARDLKDQAVAKIKQGVSAFEKNPTQSTTRGLVDAVALAASLWGPDAVSAMSSASKAGDIADMAETAEATPAAETATAAETPSRLQQVLKGRNVEQAPAQATLRQAAGAGSDVQGIRTFLDKPIADIAKTERATYDTINQAAGTDLKALYDHAEELQDALDDPTNVANKSALQQDFATTKAQIAEGEQKALANGVSPDTLDKAISLTQKRYAGEEVARKLFNNESVVKGNTAFGADETVSVDSAIRNAEQLNKPSRFAPRGTPPRLQQWFGKDGADNLLQGLYDARDAGQKAVRLRQLLKLTGKVAAGSGAAAVGGELLRRL